MKLFDLIMEAERLVDAIATHPQYRLLKDNEYLTDLDFQLGDLELFLMQLNKALGQATEAQAAGGSVPNFEELFDEESVSNSLSLLPQLTITPVNNLDDLLEERSKS